jgi:DNA-binding NarL/FixJ family response regulator
MQPNSLAGKRVMIVEDEPLVAVEHAALLLEVGAKIVATCTTVTGAIRCARENPIDVAVVDFVLADGTSEPLQILLKRRNIPFVVVSAYPPALVRTEPGQEVLQKPVPRDVLYGRVRAACKRAA